MKIFKTNINKQNPPTYEVLLELLINTNPNIKESEIIKEIKKLGIYDVPTDAPKSKKGKGVSKSDTWNSDNI